MPSTQPRNADFLVAIAPYFFIIPSRSLFPTLSVPSVLFRPPPSLHATYVRSVRWSARRVCRRICTYMHTRLGCETKRDTPPAISKMAEFNGQTLGRYSPVAMKIKVGGGYDPYRGSFGFPVAETGEKIARHRRTSSSPGTWLDEEKLHHSLSSFLEVLPKLVKLELLSAFRFLASWFSVSDPLNIFRCGWVATIWIKF